MSSGIEKLRAILKQEGYSITSVRETVFRALQQAEGPLTLQQLRLLLPGSADRASVYRTIELFERLGVIQRLQQGWKYRLELSDQFADHHHHLTCTSCGASYSFDEPDFLSNTIASLAKKHNFIVDGHQLEITGLCATCRARTVA
jgi:Fur family ferric uptake transcriptional regulator